MSLPDFGQPTHHSVNSRSYHTTIFVWSPIWSESNRDISHNQTSLSHFRPSSSSPQWPQSINSSTHHIMDQPHKPTILLNQDSLIHSRPLSLSTPWPQYTNPSMQLTRPYHGSTQSMTPHSCYQRFTASQIHSKSHLLSSPWSQPTDPPTHLNSPYNESNLAMEPNFCN